MASTNQFSLFENAGRADATRVALIGLNRSLLFDIPSDQQTIETGGKQFRIALPNKRHDGIIVVGQFDQRLAIWPGENFDDAFVRRIATAYGQLLPVW